ncbi:MAG: hypothetical protein ACLFVQ_05445 [Chitinispirillaceae bacterium]
MNMRIVWLLFLLTVCCVRSGFSQGCQDILEDIEAEEWQGDGGNGENGAVPDEAFEREIHRVFIAGLGGGYIDHPDFERVSYNFYLSALWEVWRYGAVRVGGEFVSDLEESFVGDIVAGVNVYPFAFGTTPFVGFGVGYGYGQAADQTGWGLHASADIGVFVIQGPNLQLAFSAGAFYQRSLVGGEYPVGVILRLGFII